MENDESYTMKIDFSILDDHLSNYTTSNEKTV